MSMSGSSVWSARRFYVKAVTADCRAQIAIRKRRIVLSALWQGDKEVFPLARSLLWPRSRNHRLAYKCIRRGRHYKWKAWLMCKMFDIFSRNVITRLRLATGTVNKGHLRQTSAHGFEPRVDGDFCLLTLFSVFLVFQLDYRQFGFLLWTRHEHHEN